MSKIAGAEGALLEIEITDFSDMGQGIGRAGADAGALAGLTVFVQGAFPGDRVLARITTAKKNFANAVAEQVLRPSEYRDESDVCPYAKVCGGCAYQGYSYAGQLRTKEKQVRDKLERLAGLEEPRVRPVLGMERYGDAVAGAECREAAVRAGYRNKAEFAIGEKGEVGFLAGGSHRVFDCRECRLQLPPAMAAAEALREYIRQVKPSVYSRKAGKGLLRGLVVKTAPGTGEVMAIVVATAPELPGAELLAELLDDAVYALPEAPTGVKYSLESIIINVNKYKDSRTLGDKFVTLAGKNTICEKSGNLTFEISAPAFFQVNPEQMLKLYEKALEYADLAPDSTVFDLYCGVGTIGLFAADHMKKSELKENMVRAEEATGMVYGIESVKGAVLDANRNAVINGIVNARYLCGAAEEEIFKLTEGYTDRFGEQQLPVSPDVIILDPPRAGCDEKLLQAAASAAPKRIVYVSCEPGTLARDIKILEGLGYRFAEATPVDMFPNCAGIETCCLLERLRNAKDHVTFTLDLEDYYRIKDAEADKEKR